MLRTGGERSGQDHEKRLEAEGVETIEVLDATLRKLADARADEVRAALTASRGIGERRILDAEPILLDRAPEGGAGVGLTLDAR